MNRGLLLSVLSCGVVMAGAAVGCGDDSGSGGSDTTSTSTSVSTSTSTSTKSSSSSTSTSTSTSATSSSTSSGGMATCESYCANIDNNCSGGLQQYPSTAACEEICAGFMPGTPGDMSMNTLECRAYHTGAAMGTPDPHCVHAGPLGQGPDAGAGCGGMICQSFCTAAFQVCDGNNQQFADMTECMTECGTIPNTVDYNTMEAAGNTLACRMYHMTVAADAKANGNMADFALHCGHIPADSGPCGGN